MSTPFKIMDENDTIRGGLLNTSRKNNAIINNNNPIKGGGGGGTAMKPLNMNVGRFNTSSPVKPGLGLTAGGGGGAGVAAQTGGKDYNNLAGSKTARKALVDLSHSQVNGGQVNTRTLMSSTPLVHQQQQYLTLGGISRNIMNTAFKSNKKPKSDNNNNNNNNNNSNLNAISVFEDAVVEAESSAEAEDANKYDVSEMICSRVDKAGYPDPYDIVMDNSKNLHYRIVPTITDDSSERMYSSSMDQSPADLFYFNGNYTEDIDEICRELERGDSGYRNGDNDNCNSDHNLLCCSVNPEAVTEPFDSFATDL